jgi:hypothetical protein
MVTSRCRHAPAAKRRRRREFHSNGMYPGGPPDRSSGEALWLPYRHDGMSPQTPAMCCWRPSETCSIVAEGTLRVLEMDDDVGGEPFGNCPVWATSDVGECDVGLRFGTENLKVNVRSPGAAVDIWAEKGQAWIAVLRRAEWQANAGLGRCGSDRPDGGDSATPAARRGLAGGGRSDSVGDPAHLAPGTVRTFPPLRSRAA